ncbi:hypothetical protein RchiOBHm_Chr5g0066801 [Rosa chinensis]|uniref:Uncharacterized protein n=1 Tax=Rosa chinensis TaxID=74649 RepID=A0A2P6QJ93_ROSCH|nr:hypothetical protein RchiOBHm_Chr5g0066801 [Rosa chinensis]
MVPATPLSLSLSVSLSLSSTPKDDEEAPVRAPATLTSLSPSN